MLWTWILVGGCTTAPTPEPTETHEAAEAHEGHEGHEAHAEPQKPGELVLSLDGTSKWKMDTHTREVMAETRASLDGVVPASVEEANALGATLQGQLDRLIQGCTMDGAAHDELHVFLMAWIPEVTALQSTTSVVGARARVLRLQEMLHTYEQFFE